MKICTYRKPAKVAVKLHTVEARLIGERILAGEVRTGPDQDATPIRLSPPALAARTVKGMGLSERRADLLRNVLERFFQTPSTNALMMGLAEWQATLQLDHIPCSDYLIQHITETAQRLLNKVARNHLGD